MTVGVNVNKIPCIRMPKENIHLPKFVHVYWKDALKWDEIYAEIGALNSPEIILWYMGPNGLKLEAVNFYRDKISNFLSNPENTSRINLFDLAAWKSFTNVHESINKIHVCAKKINAYGLENLRCVTSAEIFDEFYSIKNENLVRFVQKTVLNRTFIYQSSLTFADTGITVGQIFKKNCPILHPISSLDTSKAYSPIQYLEGLFLIDKLVKQKLEKSQDIELAFVLPNDESKYYRDEEDSFRNDLEFFLQEKYPVFRQKNAPKINVYFLNFTFGEKPWNRPYLSGKKNIKKIYLNQITKLKGEYTMIPNAIDARKISLADLPTAVPGFGNYDSKQQIILDIWKRSLSNVYRLNGFNPLDVPPFVRKEFLLAKGGINNEIFAINKLHGN